LRALHYIAKGGLKARNILLNHIQEIEAFEQASATTIRKAILAKRICSLNSEKIEQVDKAIKFALALE